ETDLVENYAAVLDEVVRAKPSSSKGRYLKSITLSSTMGPGIRIDPLRSRDLEELAEMAAEASQASDDAATAATADNAAEAEPAEAPS
ncbi:MAG: hypothetical protein GEU71_18125, partial [Actinobacteria bacterium]|nr:hypothetical protein [Actinomycetota bacterium]